MIYQDVNLCAVPNVSIQAGQTTLKADNHVNLLAAQNTTQESSNSSSKSGSVGVAMQLGNGGGGMGFTASASKATGQGAGNSVTYTNTKVAGNTVNIESGGDTTLKGATVKASQVTANVGGDLKIESLQDTNQYKESSKSAGGSVMVGAGFSGSVNLGQTKINSTYTSVGEQSAIRAGDGGFQVNVEGKTTLTGAQITSTQAAIDNNKNSFQAKDGTTTTDLQNQASYEAKSVSVSVGLGAGGGKVAPSGVSFGSDSGNAASTSTAGISGVAGNTAARTGDKSTSIAPIFNKEQVQKEVAAQVAITSEFGKQASKAVGDYAGSQLKDLKKQADTEADPAKKAALQAEAAKWDEGGAYRVAAHTVVGGLTGGAAGAVGAGAASAAAPGIEQLQGQLKAALKDAGMNDSAANVIAGVAGGTTAAAVGAAASGGSTAGGATAFNADMNNRQLHPSEKQRIKDLAEEKARSTCRGSSDCEKQTNLYWTDMLERAAEGRVDTQEAIKNQSYYNQVIAASGKVGSEASLGAGVRFFDDLGEAQRLLNANTGATILDAQGRPVLGTDGKPQTFFSATQAQRDNAYGNIFPGGSPNTQASVIQGKEQRDLTRLERLNTPSGQAVPDTTLEEAVIGVRVPAKGVGSVVQVAEKNSVTALAGTAKAAEEALMRSGGAFDKVGNPLLDMSKLTNEQKRVIGENLFGPNTVKQIVPDGQQIARMQGQGSNGLDELYKVKRPDVDYVNIEYKFVGQDSKTGAQVLGNTADGKQGSASWIAGSGRIEKAVGSLDEARSVKASLESGRVESWVVTVRPDGSTAVQVLDALGKPKPIDHSKIILPNLNLSGAQK
jgi:filamentous hemagglutinin